MKERPILFTGEMVRAILSVRKTQTRRVIKDLKGYESSGYDFCVGMHDGELQALTAGDHGWESTGIKCPYGQPGNRLWVRENLLWESYASRGVNYVQYEADKKECVAERPEDWIPAGRQYSHNDSHDNLPPGGINYYTGKVPSIFMPRWASRITLEITGVRVERLQDISNEDALAEGTPDLRTIENNWDMRRCFQSLWESINGADSWAANPWVWVIEFKRLT